MKYARTPRFWMLSLNALFSLWLWWRMEDLGRALESRPPIALINREAWITALPSEAGPKDFEALHQQIESLLQPLRQEGYLVIDEQFVVLAPDHLRVEP
jgi:hypothetical protein